MKRHVARWFMIGFGIATVAGVAGWIVAAGRRNQAAVERYAKQADLQPVS